MLIQALTDHFESYFNRAKHHDTVFWFDPDGEYTALLDHLTAVPLWRYEGSLLQVRYRVIHRAPGEQAVVYLPLHKDDAEVLRPFFATSLIFGERLYKFLRRQNLDFPDDPEVAHELRVLLPRLAARSVGKGRQFWEYNLANLERARETLLGNFDDALLRFLARPQVTLTELKGEKLDGLFFAQLESAYGLAASSEDDPDEIARRLTACLILTCVYTQAAHNLREHGSELEDFPYATRVAEPLYRDDCRAFVPRWQDNRTYAPAYARLADELQVRYDLTHWAVELPHDVGLTLRDTFANVQQALWTQVEGNLSKLESEDEWRTWLQAHDDPIAARADDFWAREGRDPGWRLLDLARDLLIAIQGMRQQLDHWTRPGEMLRAYARDWHCIDRDYRRLREALDAAPRAHDQLRDRCARSYRDTLRRVNDRFCTLLEAEGGWPPPAALQAQDAFWSQAMGELKAKRRVAVMFIDALRYELGQELWQALEDENAGDQRQLIARLAAIPTVTPIGMAALLPGGDCLRVAYGDGWEVTIEDSGNLKDKAARRRWLERHLDGVAFYNLDKLLDTPAGRIPEAAIYVIFDTTLDAVGETASKLACNAFSSLLRSVKKGVHKLLALGVNEVHVVTDHGFLLLDEVGEHEKVSVRTVPARAKKSRYLVGQQLGKTDQLCFPVPGSDDLVAWFPRGIGCFRTPGPYNYVHGGLSLQELVVPHLCLTQSLRGRPVGVQVALPAVIRSAQFKVTLEPVLADLLDQPRQVTLSLEKADEPLIPPLSCVVAPGEPTTLVVLLPMDCGLEQGDCVRWLLRDAATDELLAEQEAVSQVDLW